MKLYKLSNLAMFFVAILFYMTSCSKSTPPTPSSTPSDFLNVIVAGTA